MTLTRRVKEIDEKCDHKDHQINFLEEKVVQSQKTLTQLMFQMVKATAAADAKAHHALLKKAQEQSEHVEHSYTHAIRNAKFEASHHHISTTHVELDL